MSNKVLLAIGLTALSVYPMAVFIIRAKIRGRLRPALYFVVFVVIAFTAFLLLGLSNIQILASEFSFLGALLLIVLGLLLVIRGFRRKSDVDELLMELSSSRFFDPERHLFDRFGQRYFYFKSVLIGSLFILGGILSVLRKIV